LDGDGIRRTASAESDEQERLARGSQKVASERSERATRPERAGGAASEGACRGVRGAKPSE